MADPKQDEGFKVVDRRLFTDQGELRKDVVEQERRDEESAARKAASASQVAAQTNTRAPSKGVLAPDGSALTAQRGHHLESLGIEKLIEISKEERAVGQRAAEEEEDGDREKPGMRLTDDAAHQAFSKAPIRRNFL